MHKTNSPVPQGRITYVILPDGSADIWIRSNEVELPETEEGPVGYEADEVYCKISSAEIAPESEIEADVDFWFENLKDLEEGANADFLAKENYRSVVRSAISAACEHTIYEGVDVELSTGVEHFSLTSTDQTNLFGKQAELSAGAEEMLHTIEMRMKQVQNLVFTTRQQICRKSLLLPLAFVTYNTTYCNSMFVWLDNLTKASEMAALFYGADIPEEYQSEVLSDYLSQIGA